MNDELGGSDVTKNDYRKVNGYKGILLKIKAMLRFFCEYFTIL
ncbi:hypothetical protein LPICM02_340094 [Pseudolactococcus piscium]|nr:hypothetical protein LPICM02_340094 [Lactococcus piscium]